MKSKADEVKNKAMVILRNPSYQTYTVATVGGAVTFGTAGGAFGLASGVVVGSAAGVLPALFTFGLSIPVGAVVGGAGGLCGGTLIGAISGGVGGFTTYKYRLEIKNGLLRVSMKARDSVKNTKEKTIVMLNVTKVKLHAQAGKLQDSAMKLAKVATASAKAKSSEAINFATTTRAGVTTSSAVAGAVLGGTATGAFGAAAGVAVGVVPALFTFGLSIPVCGVIGLCAGSTIGGSVGAAGGGLAGYVGFAHRKAVAEGAQSSWHKVSATADNLKVKTFECAADAKKSFKSLVRPSTGGSDESR